MFRSGEKGPCKKAICLIILLFLLCCGPSWAWADLGKLKSDLKQAVLSLPEDSKVLHDKLLEAGERFEKAGIYSEARRYYKYLDILWDKHPPAEKNDHQRLRTKIAAIAKKQDVPQALGDARSKEDALILYHPLYHPGQRLEFTVTRKEKDGIWVLMHKDEGNTAAQAPPPPPQIPALYSADALGQLLQFQLPDIPGSYELRIYTSQGEFLTGGKIQIAPKPVWQDRLKVETQGYPGFAGIPVRPETDFDLIIQNKGEWVKGVAGKRPWVGLFKKEAPMDSKKYLTYWYIHQKKEFTRIRHKIKDAGAYQLRIFSEDSPEKELLLATDLTVGEPGPVRVEKRGGAPRPPLEFDKKQRIKIVNTGLKLKQINSLDPYCLVLPSWFEPADIRHGMNHALAVNDGMARGSGPELELPGTGGSYDIILYPHWMALKTEATPIRLARVRVKGKHPARLTVPQKTYLPGANIRAGIQVGEAPGTLYVHMLPPENLQVRGNKAGYIRDKRYSVSLDAAQYEKGRCWFDITAPLEPGKYFLTAYDSNLLVSAIPIRVENRPRKAASLVVSDGPYQAGQAFSFKAFPPPEGMPRHGTAVFSKDGKDYLRRTLYAAHMDYPVQVQAPKETGTYDINFFVNGDPGRGEAQPAARAKVTFVDGADMPEPLIPPEAPALSPDAVAAFRQDTLLPGAELAEFNMYTSEVLPDQDLHISYFLPRSVPACVLMLPEGPEPASLAQAAKRALKRVELDTNNDLVTLRAPDPGTYVLYVYDTFQWSKAGPPKQIARIPFRVKDVYGVRLAFQETAYARGDLGVKLTVSPEEGFSREWKGLRLYPDTLNITRNSPAAAAAAFKKITRGVFHAKLSLNLTPGNYLLKIDDYHETYPVRLIDAPDAFGEAGIRLIDPEVMPEGLATVEFSPGPDWTEAMSWALAKKDGQGAYQFAGGPVVIKQPGNRISRVTFTAPGQAGDYQISLWKGSGQKKYADLPAEVKTRLLKVGVSTDYDNRHQPAVSLQAYFSTTDALYTGMYTQGQYTASIRYDKTAWIGILPEVPAAAGLDSPTARQSAIWATGLNGNDAGEFSFIAPEEPGRYQVCMYDGGAKNSRLVLHRTIQLDPPDMARLEREADAAADAFLESLPEVEQQMESIRETHRQIYKENLEVPRLSPIPVSPDLLETLQDNAGASNFSGPSRNLLAFLSPSAACAADKRNCEDDIDLAIATMRQVNINFGDGVNLRHVVGDLATKMASDLAMGQKYIAQAKQHYDQSKAYYDTAMKLKSGLDKDGWQETVKGAVWDSTQSMLKSCVSKGCLSNLGKKVIEQKLKGYNPLKMTKAELKAWKEEYARMVVLLNESDLRALETQTAKYAELSGKLRVTDPDADTMELARMTAINAMKTYTMSLVSKNPAWPALKAYYETLNVLKGALINDQTVDFMDKYRKLRGEGGTISQVNDVLSAERISHLQTSLRERIEGNPKGYKAYLNPENLKLCLGGNPINLSDKEIDNVIMGYMEKWYQQEIKDKQQDSFYSEMKDAWYNSKCSFESYKAVVDSKNF